MKVYIVVHFMTVLFAYEGVSLFKNVSVNKFIQNKFLKIKQFQLQRLSPLAIFCHLFYVLFSMTTTGMFFDGHHLAPLFEFVRCASFFVYSLRGLPLLESTLTWMGLVDLYGPSAVSYTTLLLQIYFIVSAAIWSLIPAINLSSNYIQKKLK